MTFDPRAQYIFDQTARHLLTQGKKAIDPASGDCLYRGPAGTKCAVGYWIPDDKYAGGTREEGGMEHCTVRQLCEMFHGAMPDDTQHYLWLFHDLQRVHDCHTPDQWREQLGYVARYFGLSEDVIAAPVS